MKYMSLILESMMLTLKEDNSEFFYFSKNVSELNSLEFKNGFKSSSKYIDFRCIFYDSS